MKTLFLSAEADVDIIPVLKKALARLPEKIGIVTTAQHLAKLDEAKSFLEKNGKKVEVGGQVLGCNADNALRLKSECILFIGSGNFHPIEIGKTKKIIKANPFTIEVSEIDKSVLDKIEKRKKGALLKFYSSEKIGVIMTTKKGQSVKVDRKKLEKKYPGKKFYYFMTETLLLNDLENFPFIQCWVNTMCPRIAYEDVSEKSIVNLIDI